MVCPLAVRYCIEVICHLHQQVENGQLILIPDTTVRSSIVRLRWSSFRARLENIYRSASGSDVL